MAGVALDHLRRWLAVAFHTQHVDLSATQCVRSSLSYCVFKTFPKASVEVHVESECGLEVELKWRLKSGLWGVGLGEGSVVDILLLVVAAWLLSCWLMASCCWLLLGILLLVVLLGCLVAGCWLLAAGVLLGCLVAGWHLVVGCCCLSA